jgi:NADH-quinone oxidoreductase subunit A
MEAFWKPGILTLGVYAGMVLALTGVLLFLCRWLGERRATPEKQRPYECGILPTGPAQFPYPVPFYLIAIFFLIFDVEAAFIFAWAVAFEDLGWAGWLQIVFFITILLFGLVYIWGKGGLDWRNKSARSS